PVRRLYTFNGLASYGRLITGVVQLRACPGDDTPGSGCHAVASVSVHRHLQVLAAEVLFPTGTLLEDGVDRDSRHGSDRRTGAASDRGRALARAHAARRARSARGTAALGRERALDVGLSARDRWPRASRSFCDVGGD